MKLYKCNYCGRVFDKQMPHKCTHGFRKNKHSWTEIDDSKNEYVLKSEPSKDDILKKELCNALTKWGLPVTKIERMDIERRNPFHPYLSRTILTVTFE